MDLDESARRAGAAGWEEQRLYEVVGGWVEPASAPRAKVYFDSVSQHHAWRASLWRERLPARLVARPAPAAGPMAPLLRPSSEAAAAALDALAALEGDAARLGAYCRVVLPRAVVRYRQWQRACSPVSDRPVLRVLGLALADVVADWQEGCEVLAEVLSGSGGGMAAAVKEAAESAAGVERLMLREGPTEIA